MDLNSTISSANEFYKPEKSGSKVSPVGSNSSTIFCRICHEGEGLETLMAPCHCTGTVALIHRTCLERWLTSSNSDKCEICKHEYNTSREPRSCVEYVQDSSNQFNVRNLIADLVCFCLLTPLLVVSTYLCVIGATQYFVRERWEAVGLVVLSLFLTAVYLTWCHVTIKFHCGVWLTWQRTNQRVRLIEIVNCRTERECESRASQIQHPPSFCSIEIENLQLIPGTNGSSTTPTTSTTESEESLENECDTSRIIV